MKYPFNYIVKHNNLYDFIKYEVKEHVISKSRQYHAVFNVHINDIYNKEIDIHINSFCPINAFYKDDYIIIYDYKTDVFKNPLNIDNEKYSEIIPIIYNSIKFLNGVNDDLYKSEVFQVMLLKFYKILFPKYYYYEKKYEDFNTVYNLAIETLGNLNEQIVTIDRYNKFIDGVNNEWAPTTRR